MNSTLKGVIIFSSGVAVGALGMYVGLKKYFEEKEERNVEDVKIAFGKRLDELEEANKKAVNVAKEAITSSEVYKNGKIGDNEATKEALKGVGMIDGIIESKNKEKVDYTAYSSSSRGKKSEMTERDELYPREEDVGDEEFDDGSDPSDCEATDLEDGNGPVDLGNGRIEMPNGDIIHTTEFRKEGDGQPYEISPDDYGSIIGYEATELMYYQGDGIVADDNDEIVENPAVLIGNVIGDTGFDVDGRTSMYVRNDHISTDFEIYKVRGTYGVS